MFRYESKRCDYKGIPFININAIEKLSIDFLEKFAPKSIIKPPFEIYPVLEELQKKHGVQLSFEQNLGTLNGKKVLGKIRPSKKLWENIIFIDKQHWGEPDDPRCRFTIAHEIGHLALHSKAEISSLDDCDTLQNRDLVDTESNFSLFFDGGPRNWLEYQANKFATGLLMPVAAIEGICFDAIKETGIINAIYNNISVREFLSQYKAPLLNELPKKFRVSKQAMSFRLENLHFQIECGNIKLRNRNRTFRH